VDDQMGLDQEFLIVELEPRKAPAPDGLWFGSGGSGGSGGGSGGSGGSGGGTGGSGT
jgi:hypothetical protein